MIIISDFGSSDEDVEAAFSEQVEAGKAWGKQAKGIAEKFLAWEYIRGRELFVFLFALGRMNSFWCYELKCVHSRFVC